MLFLLQISVCSARWDTEKHPFQYLIFKEETAFQNPSAAFFTPKFCPKLRKTLLPNLLPTSQFSLLPKYIPSAVFPAAKITPNKA